MPILDPYTGGGALSDAEVKCVAEAERDGWGTLRSLQGNQECDVLRYTTTAGDASRGIDATKTLVADLTGIPVLWSNLSKTMFRDDTGIDIADGDRRFEFWTVGEMFSDDLILYDGQTWAIMRVHYDDHIGNTIADARLAPGQA